MPWRGITEYGTLSGYVHIAMGIFVCLYVIIYILIFHISFAVFIDKVCPILMIEYLWNLDSINTAETPLGYSQFLAFAIIRQRKTATKHHWLGVYAILTLHKHSKAKIYYHYYYYYNIQVLWITKTTLALWDTFKDNLCFTIASKFINNSLTREEMHYWL